MIRSSTGSLNLFTSTPREFLCSVPVVLELEQHHSQDRCDEQQHHVPGIGQAPDQRINDLSVAVGLGGPGGDGGSGVCVGFVHALSVATLPPRDTPEPTPPLSQCAQATETSNQQSSPPHDPYNLTVENRRYQVFVSSTYVDLVEERDQVIKALLELGHIPVGMEMFSAADEEQWETIKREIERSDYYVLIIAHRYGSTIKAEGGISYTEKEYEYAGQVGVPRLSFVIQEGVARDPKYVDSGAQKKRLDAFKAKAMSKMIKPWTDSAELGLRVSIALQKQANLTPRPGWQRATESSDLALATLARLTDENAQLRAENARLLAMNSSSTPELDIFFGVDATSDSKVIDYIIHPALELEELILPQVPRLQEMVDRLCTMGAPQIRSDHSFTSLMARTGMPGTSKYQFDHARIIRAINLLRRIGVNIPENMSSIQFEYLTHPMIFTINRYSEVQEPDQGADLPRYREFSAIERVLGHYLKLVDQRSYARSHTGVQLSIINKGRVAAENMSVRLELPDGITAGPFRFDIEQMPEVEDGSTFTDAIGLLPPHDNSELTNFVLRFDPGVEVINFKVRIVGRNLPEPQVIPLQINIHEAAAGE